MKQVFKYNKSPGLFIPPKNTKRKVIVIGGGHNGLVCASYLAKNNIDVLVLERRHIIGGAAVTEEIIPGESHYSSSSINHSLSSLSQLSLGFKFSRASYLAGLLRPQIIKDLELKKYGFEYISRDPSSFTPTKLDDPMYKG